MGDDAALALGTTVQPLRRSIPYPLCARSPGAAESRSSPPSYWCPLTPKSLFPAVDARNVRQGPSSSRRVFQTHQMDFYISYYFMFRQSDRTAKTAASMLPSLLL